MVSFICSDRNTRTEIDMGIQPADEIEALEGQITRYHLLVMADRACTHRDMFGTLSETEQAAWAELHDARLSYLRPPRGSDYQALTQAYLDLLKHYVEAWVDTWSKRKGDALASLSAAPQPRQKRLYLRWFDFGSLQLPCPWFTSK